MNARNRPGCQTGLTLIEVAISLVVLGIILSFGFSIVGPLIKTRDLVRSKRLLDEAKGALIGFALINDHLPEVDSNQDGTADGGANYGFLPYADLQSRAGDAQGRGLAYDVRNNLDNTPPPTLKSRLSPMTGPGPRISVDGNPAFAVAAVIISRGKNGTLDGDNADGNRIYETYETTSPPAGFDDLVIYLGGPELVNRLP